MSRRTSFGIVLFSVGAVVVGSLLARAGDLSPPVGPVAPTMKDLDTVEPRIPIGPETTLGDANSLFRIAAPGSYYLTGDITGVAGLSGIEIGAHDVTIDLMGFTLRGVAGSLDGIVGDGAIDNIRITNGVIRNWGSDGIDIASGTGHGHHVSVIHAEGNVLDGMRCDNNAIIESCNASANGSEGIVCFGPNAVVRSCAAFQNGAEGILIILNGTLTDCATYENGGTGILSGHGSLVANCCARNNTGDGIGVGNGAVVTACSAYNNDASGIVTGEGCTISNCTASANTRDGIVFSLDCHVRHNTCDSNGFGTGDGAGIHVNGGDNRIEGNNCTDNDRGIDVDGAGNVVICNTCSGNTTNYVIVAGNMVGTIVTTEAAMNAATNDLINISF